MRITIAGLPGPGKGTGVGGVSWKIGLKKLVWTLGLPRGGMPAGMLRLNSTVWWSRNTTGDAPSNSPPSAVGVTPGAQIGDVTHCPDPSMSGRLYTQHYAILPWTFVVFVHHTLHHTCETKHRNLKRMRYAMRRVSDLASHPRFTSTPHRRCYVLCLAPGHLYARTLLRRPGYYSYRQQSDVLVIHHNGHSPCNGGKKRSSGCSDW